jgi:transcriptional regulator with XRE-family HTH domain
MMKMKLAAGQARAERTSSMATSQPLSGLIAETLRLRRAELGLTQREIAEALGVVPNFITQVEVGGKRISLDRIPALATVLHLDPSTLCHWALLERAPELYRELFEQNISM